MEKKDDDDDDVLFYLWSCRSCSCSCRRWRSKPCTLRAIGHSFGGYHIDDAACQTRPHNTPCMRTMSSRVRILDYINNVVSEWFSVDKVAEQESFSRANVNSN